MPRGDKRHGATRRAMEWGSVIATACLLVTITACASAPPGPPNFAQKVQQRLVAANETDRHTLRYNPTPCNCPTFEIALGKGWVRVAFDAPVDDPLMVQLQAATAAATAQERTFVLTGSLSSELRTCAKGVILVTLAPTGWLDGP